MLQSAVDQGLHNRLVGKEIRKTVDETPDFLRVGAKVVRAVGMNPHAAGMKMIVNIAADVWAALQYQDFAAGIGQSARDRCTGQPGTDDEEVDRKRHASVRPPAK
jgi:hypothetical protein